MTRIDPVHGVETTVSDHTSELVELTGGRARMVPVGPPSCGRTVAEMIGSRKRFPQPKGSSAIGVAWHPVMDALAVALHSRAEWLRTYSWADGRVSINGQLYDLGSAREMLGLDVGKVAAPKIRKEPAAKPAPVAAAPVPAEAPPAARADLPPDVVALLERLVFTAKRDYAEQYARARVSRQPLPADPGTEWAAKARRSVDRLV